jgi:ubiquinone/menaquinone biosynthesis C-methylase UbiE
MEPQAFSVKRAEVEFHRFASLGEPERVFAVYAEENERRRGLMLKHADFIGPISPFLEIGANAGHTSYMLANEFGANGFALDLSADALRYGTVLKERWGLARTPIRIAGDATRLPFRDGCFRFVAAFQFLSQFTDIEYIFGEVKRVLAPGGIFFFAEEPMKRMLSLRLYRCPYYESMKVWERKLYDWGLLGYLVRDHIGSGQEESFGIQQNQRFTVADWHTLLSKHFAIFRSEVFVPERGWGERVVKKLAIRLDPYHSAWRAARLLGGTLAAICRKHGQAGNVPDFSARPFEDFLRCPDCQGALRRDPDETLSCACGFRAMCQDGVYTLLPSAEREELYPASRQDILDFSQPGHEQQLLEGWGALEGVYGNKYRWIGRSASARLIRCKNGPQRLRVRGHASEHSFSFGESVKIKITANGKPIGQWGLERPGLFVLEADLPDAPEYLVQIEATPVWQAPPDVRSVSVNLSLLRLIDKENAA